MLGCGLTTAAAAPDQNAASFGKYWQEFTLGDLAAAHALLRDNHPGAAPELGDVQFQRALLDAYRLAQQRAAKVANYEGYIATLAAFGTSFGDKHIRSTPAFRRELLNWPSFIVARKGSDWIVTDEDPGGEDLKGYRLLSCDGRPAEAVAKERLGQFKAIWEIQAQQRLAAPWLLIDDGNPFVTPISGCTFAKGEDIRNISIKWSQKQSSELSPRLRAAAGAGAAGFGVRKFAGGSWISLQSLGDRAGPVVDEVRKRADELRASGAVVLDMRGNGGGNSAYGDQIAEALLGAGLYRAAIRSLEDAEDCPKLWRASPANIKTLQEYKAKFGPRLGKDYERETSDEIDRLTRAVANGESFSGPVACKPKTRGPQASAPLPWPGKFTMVVLTDSLCFSSCLSVTDRLRRMGATHVGQTTDANTHYMENRTVLLPSGLSYFSTQQAVDLGAPRQMGPFIPRLEYNGDIADTAELENWVTEVVRLKP